MVKDGPKGSTTVKKRFKKRSKTIKTVNRFKTVNTVKGDQKWSKLSVRSKMVSMVKNCPKTLQKTSQNSHKWSITVKNNQNRSKLVENGQKRSKPLKKEAKNGQK